MKIESKFDINNLVERKFDTNSKDSVNVMEVMEVLSNTCYAGTQIFYLCRPIMCKKEFEHQFKTDGEFKWVICHRISTRDDNAMGWNKYREDELIEAPQSVIDIVLGVTTGSK